ncbi:ABC transporter permease [Flavitalea sp. BT771]|uniref:ABC transporter permease n=1 Tax=Flavitalea sp. BT771 TaxID=3063329 RepID=UPI0026E117A9|nr:ABC transporter permease [Flavitalea sp. BT771]MDO6433205.1 ABC transporter permease [Flavitalea sp. BT771]MDV6221519.1 ABC transporter permease [Flavitalea sp. BT771]
MLINYLKTTIRAIRKSPIYGLLNIAGLALGIACAAMIFLWVEDELAFDHAVAKRNELYSIRMNIDYSGRVESFTSVPGPMSNAIRGTIPGIVNTTRLGIGRELFGLKDKTTYEHGFYVDTSYFSMTQPTFVKGSAAGFNNPHSLVLSETMARKFFGEADPVGKTLRVSNQEDYTVLGVVKDPLQNVSLQFSFLAPVANFFEKNEWLNFWGTWGITTLVELQPGTDVNKVNQQLTAVLRSKNKVYTNGGCLLWSMNDWHLYDNYTNGQPDGGGIRFVKLFSAIAWIILFIACINFMNLATARAGQRVKEIGVRKTLGALKNGLIGQFILEALLMSFVAVLLAILLVYLFLPGFNVLFDKQLRFDVFKPAHLYGLLALGVFCGLIAGAYPAFYLSSFQPVAVLKGQRISPGTGASFIRKGLVVVQFTISVALIVCTVIIYQQVQHIKDRDLGYNKQRLLYMEVQGNMAEHFNAIKSQLLQTGAVENAALSGSPALAMWGTVPSSRLTWEGSDPDNKIKIHWESASPEYISTMGLQLKEGRNFNTDVSSDSGNVIINESLAKLMGKAGRLGGILTYSGTNVYHVVGIVRDYLFNNMYEQVNPLVLACDPEKKGAYGFLAIRLRSGGDLSSRLAKVEAVMKANNPGFPFDYQFADEQFDRLFRGESRLGELAGVFAGLAILISCIGLFGLAAYTAERRTKELGIRKVLGASVANLTSLLSKEFLQLVVLSCLIAFPLAWWMMNVWLANYAYRTEIHWWVFGIAGVVALTIAMLTVTSQAVRAALSDPVETLRSE